MNKIARFLLTASSIAPVGITLIFIGYMKNKPWLIWWSLGICLASFISVIFSYTMQIKTSLLFIRMLRPYLLQIKRLPIIS